MLLDLSLTLLASGLLIVSLLAYACSWLMLQFAAPPGLPWVGAGTSIPSRTWATFMSIVRTRKHLEEGYYRYSKNEQTYILPNLLSGPEVIIPMSQLRWLLEQPDNVLNQNEINRQFLAADYTMLHPNIIRDTVHEHVIRGDLTRQIGALTPAMVEEISMALDEAWGTDEERHTVHVNDTMAHIVRRNTNRLLVGLPLCRNEEYIFSTGQFCRKVVLTAALVNLLPKFLRWPASHLITLQDRQHYNICAKYTLPMIKERLEMLNRKTKDPCFKYEEPNDYLQWALHDSFAQTDPEERSPDMIAKRLTILGFAAIQSSIITMTNVLFDLASSPHVKDYMASIREEVQRALSETKGVWTKATVAKLVRADSAIKESMRLSGLISRGVTKQVIAPEGITLPSGIHLSFGHKVGVSSWTVHHDESIYSDPYTYDAFRFSRPYEEAVQAAEAAAKLEAPNRAAAPKKTVPSLAVTTENFMAFSHGRHACAGRFFAAAQMKLILAHIALKYEVQPITVRPTNTWFNNVIVPPLFATLRIRRRPETQC